MNDVKGDSKARILLVGDDDDVLWMMTAVLRKDFEVLTAMDGGAALAALAQNDVDCVIADQMMPGISGTELLDRAHDLRPETARVLLTGIDQQRRHRDAINAGRVHRCLSKPLRLADLPLTLVATIREAKLSGENSRLEHDLTRSAEELKRAKERLDAEVRKRTKQLEAAVVQLGEMALRDGLTGLYNHRYFQESLDSELSRAKRHGHPVGLVFLDVDHFKHYNDKHGHPAGDRLLRKLADLLTGGRTPGSPAAGRRSDVVARYGGEEFVLVLPETPLEGTIVKAERICKAISEQSFEHGSEQPLGCVSVSVGVSAFPEHGSAKQQLIDAADRELYRAKAEGRNRVCVSGKR